MPEELAWRIDSLDPRGGLAFASYRDLNYLGKSDRGRDPQCVFMGPPGFQPEMVANRSLALAAVRGAFQERFFVDDREVTFPSLASVVEFVRRIYLRSAGGDGEEGGGAEKPPPLPLDSPDRPRPRLVLEKTKLPPLAKSLGLAISTFHKSTPKFGEIEEFSGWPGSRVGETQKPTSSQDDVLILASAALRLIQEFLLRMPEAGHLVEFIAWHESARRFGDVLSAMGLWETLGFDPYRDALIKLIKPLSSWNFPSTALNDARTHPQDEFRTTTLCVLLFGRSMPLHDARFAGHWQAWATHSSAIGDRVADLCRIPLPKEFEPLVLNDVKQPVSLYQALTAFIASPTLPATDSSQFFGLILFAATWIALSEIARGSAQVFLPGGAMPGLKLIQNQQVMDAGWNWLRNHLPNIRFASEVEHAIEGASDLRYSTPPRGRGGTGGQRLQAHL